MIEEIQKIAIGGFLVARPFDEEGGIMTRKRAGRPCEAHEVDIHGVKSIGLAGLARGTSSRTEEEGKLMESGATKWTAS